MKKYRIGKHTWSPAIAAKNIASLAIKMAAIAAFLACVGFNPMGIY